MLVIAHRGLSSDYPENTMLAFEKAIDAGVKAIECDVHQVEESFVIFHDMHLDKLTGVNGVLAQSSMASLQTLQIKGSDQHIPKLQEVIALCAGKVLINLELKKIHDPKLLVQQLCDYTAQCDSTKNELNLVLSSFDHPLLQSVRSSIRNTALEKKTKFAALIAHLPLDNAEYAIKAQADIAAIDAHLVSEDFVRHAKENFIEVWCYTVNHDYLLFRLVEMGIDGVFCDDINWAHKALTGLALPAQL